MLLSSKFSPHRNYSDFHHQRLAYLLVNFVGKDLHRVSPPFVTDFLIYLIRGSNFTGQVDYAKPAIAPVNKISGLMRIFLQEISIKLVD